MKSAITVVLGLVLQLSLVMPGLAAIMTDLTPVAASCKCCSGLDACPCAHEEEPTQAPLPLAPESGQNLKVPLAKVTGTRVSIETISRPQSSASTVTATPVTGPWTGYSGVPLSVAYCSFVI